MALPDTNISTSLIGSTLGTSARDVGTLCAHANINKYSKWKPIRVDAPGGITLADIIDARSGMDIPQVNGAVNLISYYRANPNPIWGYNKPNSNYRLGDFRNYEHNATLNYELMWPSQVIQIGNPMAWATLSPPLNSNSIDWESLGFNDLYFGIVVVRSGFDQPWSLGFADVPLSNIDDGWYAETPVPAPVINATYGLYAFVGEKITFPSIGLGNAFLLEGGSKSFRYAAQAVLGFSGVMVSPGRFTWELMIQNNTPSHLILNNSTVSIRYGDKQFNDPLETSEMQQSIGTIDIMPYESYNNSGEFVSALNDYNSRGGYLYFSNTSNPSLNQQFYILND